MELLIVLAVSAVACVALRQPLRKCPGVFYAAALVPVGLLMAGTAGLLDGSWWKLLVPLVQHGTVAFALFAIVMLVGALPAGGRLAAWLRPVRGELSLVALVLCLGHVAPYAAPYLQRVASGAASGATVAAFTAAAVMVVLLLVLGATSLRWVKARMSTARWKRIQCGAYGFFLLVYVHLACMLAPSALRGGVEAAISLGAYTIVVAVYVVARLARALFESKAARGVGCAENPVAALDFAGEAPAASFASEAAAS